MQIFQSRSARVAALLCPLFLVAACGGSDDQQASAEPVAAPVETQRIEPQTITYTERLPGRVTAYKVAEIRPQVSGVIMERSFTEGAMVKERQQLYQIDPALYQAAYDSARADLQRARANVKSVQAREKRYAELVAIDAVSKQEFDDITASLAQARADIAVAEARVATARINLDYTKVYSPIAGRIGKSSVTEGALVTANQPEVLAKVTQLDPIYVDMTQSSAEITRIRRQLGDLDDREPAVKLKLEDGSLYSHEGRLQFSDVTVDATTGSVQLRAIFPNPDQHLLPGMFVQTELQLEERTEILVPQKATTRNRDGNLMLWLAQPDGTVQPADIHVLREFGDQWIIGSGVESGDVVVTAGYQRLQPGAAIAATPVEGADNPVTISPAHYESEEMTETIEQTGIPPLPTDETPALPQE